MCQCEGQSIFVEVHFPIGTSERATTGGGVFLNRSKDTLQCWAQAQVHHRTHTCFAANSHRVTCRRRAHSEQTDGNGSLALGPSHSYAQRRNRPLGAHHEKRRTRLAGELYNGVAKQPFVHYISALGVSSGERKVQQPSTYVRNVLESDVEAGSSVRGLLAGLGEASRLRESEAAVPRCVRSWKLDLVNEFDWDSRSTASVEADRAQRQEDDWASCGCGCDPSWYPERIVVQDGARKGRNLPTLPPEVRMKQGGGRKGEKVCAEDDGPLSSTQRQEMNQCVVNRCCPDRNTPEGYLVPPPPLAGGGGLLSPLPKHCKVWTLASARGGWTRAHTDGLQGHH